jgi:hypothetical protein
MATPSTPSTEFPQATARRGVLVVVVAPNDRFAVHMDQVVALHRTRLALQFYLESGNMVDLNLGVCDDATAAERTCSDVLRLYGEHMLGHSS